MRPQTVQIFSLVKPRPGTAKEKRRYRLKWRIDGRDKSRTFRTRAEGDRFRVSLLHAQQAGLRFDLGTGLPVEWAVSAETWWSWSRRWVALKWPMWSGNSRRSAVESVVALTPHLAVAGAPRAPEGLRDHLRTALVPGAVIVLAVIGGFIAVLAPLLYQQISLMLEAISKFFSREDLDDRLFSWIAPETRDDLLKFVQRQIEGVLANLTDLLRERSDLLQPVASGSLDAARETMRVVV
jgi:hypothetical protein